MSYVKNEIREINLRELKNLAESVVKNQRKRLKSLPSGNLVGSVINKLVLHHTAGPTISQYKGLQTIKNIQSYHINTNGWSDIGYHVLIGPDGKIFYGRNIGYSGGHTTNQNSISWGLSMIGNFDYESMPKAELLSTIQVIAVLLDALGYDETALHFHREYAQKSCPGNLVKLDTLRRLVKTELDSGLAINERKVITIIVDGEKIKIPSIIENGTTFIEMRTFIEAFDEIVNTVKIKVGWNAATKKATINGQDITIPGKLINNKTMNEIRPLVSELDRILTDIEINLVYVPETKEIIISTQRECQCNDADGD